MLNIKIYLKVGAFPYQIKLIKKYNVFFNKLKKINLSDDKNENFEKIKFFYKKIRKYIGKIDYDNEEINRLFDFAFRHSIIYKDMIAPETDYFLFFKKIMRYQYHQQNPTNKWLRNEKIDEFLSSYEHSIDYLDAILNKNFLSSCLNKFKKIVKDQIKYTIEAIKDDIEKRNICGIFPLAYYSEKLVKLFNKAFPQFRGLKTVLTNEKKLENEKESEFFNRTANESDCYVVLWFPDEDAEWIGSRNGTEAIRKKRFKNKDTYLVFNDMDDKHKVSGKNVIKNDISVKEENRL